MGAALLEPDTHSSRSTVTVVTCLRSRAVSRSWEYHVLLLQRTLDSLLAQADSAFRIIVVCHEVPDIPQLRHPRVHALSVDFSVPERDNDEMCADKVLKLTAGVDLALTQGTDYVMFADGDDLVSNRIGPFVAANDGAPGWFSNSEYFHHYGSRWLRRHQMQPERSGPIIIVRAEFLRFADATDPEQFWHRSVSQESSERYLRALAARGPRVNTLAAVGHTNYVALLKSEGVRLEPLPFIPSVVILHSDSTSNVAGDAGSKADGSGSHISSWRKKASCFKQFLTTVPDLRPVTPSLQKEFSIPTESQRTSQSREGVLHA